MKKSSVSFPVFHLAVKIVGKNGRVSVVETELEFHVGALNAEPPKLLGGFKGRMGILRFWSHLWLSWRKQRASVPSWGILKNESTCFTGSSAYEWFPVTEALEIVTYKVSNQPTVLGLQFNRQASSSYLQLVLRSHDCICDFFFADFHEKMPIGEAGFA